MNPRLSIIIITLNEEHYIARLLKSIQKQDFADYEVIVADNDSTDNTRSVATKFGCRIVDGGLPPVARNNGAKNAKGELLLFLDADVELPNSNFLSDVLNEFKSRNLDMATCFIEPISKKKIDHLIMRIANYFMKKVIDNNPHVPGFFILAKRSAHDEIEGFNESLKLCEDHDYAKRMRNIGILNCHKIPVSVRRFDAEGRTRLVLKYVWATVYRMFGGNAKNELIKYNYNYHK